MEKGFRPYRIPGLDGLTVMAKPVIGGWLIKIGYINIKDNGSKQS